MARLNKNVRAQAGGPLRTSPAASGTTALGHPGYDRDDKTELFALGLANFVGQDTHHENAVTRDARFRDLTRSVAVADPAWMRGFLGYLRGYGNIRTAPVLAACEAVSALSAAGKAGGRPMLSAAMLRADEPGEAWAYWLENYGRKTPVAFQRGTGDAVARLYSERSLLRYDNSDASLRFGDVIELTRPRYGHRLHGTWRDALYRYAIMTRHGRDIPAELLAELPLISRAREIFALPAAERRAFLTGDGGAQAIADAGIKWEAVAGWLQGAMDAAAWEACIPSMGIFARARNLRNFDKAGVSDAVAELVTAQFSDAAEVAASRMLPFRWLAAYRHAPSLRWAYPLEQALNHSLQAVPALTGPTLVLADRSLSMFGTPMSENSDMDWADAAAIFAAALAVRGERVTLAEFSGKSGIVPVRRGESVLRVVERFGRGDGYGPLASGTDIPSAVKAHLKPEHKRVIIVTDEQTRAGMLPSNLGGYYHGGSNPCEINDLIPAATRVYMWNIGGYTKGAMATGPNRHLLTGLGDGAFRQIETIERGIDAKWPWEE